jgi:hypothetical protein
MRKLTQRFYLEFVAIINATFNTNRLRMLFIQMIKIINTGKSFPTLFSFAILKSKLAFNFIFETSRDFIFTGQNVIEPDVIIGD